MNIDQQRNNFQRAYVKTDYYRIHYDKTNTANSAFSWNNEANHYTWHDVNSAWEMWLAAQHQEGYVLAPVEPTDEMWSSGIDAYVDATSENKILKASSIVDIYEAMIQAAQE